jgi:hypothetical protein
VLQNVGDFAFPFFVESRLPLAKSAGDAPGPPERRAGHYNPKGKSMNRILLLGILCAILIAGVCLQRSTLATAAFGTASITANHQGNGSVFKFREAGIQFLVPPGWEVETDKSGTVTFSKLQDASFVVAAFSTLPPEASDLTPEAQFKAAAEGVFSDAKKDFKEFKLGAIQKETQNSMPLTSQAFAGKKDGVDMRGSVTILKAAKLVLVYVYGTAKNSDAFDKDVSNLLGSIKKIE